MKLRKLNTLTKEEINKIKDKKKSMMICIRLFTVKDDYYKYIDCYDILEKYDVFNKVRKAFDENIGKAGEFSETEFVKQTCSDGRLVIGQAIGGNYKKSKIFKSMIDDPDGVEQVITEYFSSIMVDKSKMPNTSSVPYFQALMEDFKTPAVRNVLKESILSNENTINEIDLVFPEYLLSNDTEKLSNMISKIVTRSMTEIVKDDELGDALTKKAMMLALDLNDANDIIHYASLVECAMSDTGDIPETLN